MITTIALAGSLAFALGLILGWLVQRQSSRRKHGTLQNNWRSGLEAQESKLAELQQENKQKQQRIHWLETERDDLDLQLKDLSNLRKREAREFEDKLAQRVNALQELKKKYKHLEDRLSLMVSKSDYSRLQLQLNKREKELVRLTTQHTQLSQEVQLKNEQLRQYETTLTRLLVEQETTTESRSEETPPPHYEELEAAYQQLEEEFREQRKVLEDWQRQAERWVEKATLEQLEQDHKQLKRQLAALDTGEVTVSIQEMEVLQAQRQELREQVERLQLELNRYKYGLEVTASERKDDLKQISGIGTVIEQKLNAVGITSWVQIAALDAEDIRKLTKIIRFFPGRIQRDNWVEQAEALIQQSD